MTRIWRNTGIYQSIVRAGIARFTIFILVLLAGCTSTADVSTVFIDPDTTDTPRALTSTIETASKTPLPTNTAATKPATEPSKAITPSVDVTANPDEVVIILHQEGGYAGIDDVRILYQDGRIEKNGELSGQLSAQELFLLLETLDQSSFFELDHPEPGNFCCDFFTLTVSATVGDKFNAISISNGDPDLPAEINEIISLLLQAIPP
jgi:hypothetical protein